MTLPFKVAGGSVPGTDHTMPGQPAWRNDQDAYAWAWGDDALAAFVADGCGSAPHSEVGAKIVAATAANAALRWANMLDGPVADDFSRRLAHSVLARVELLAEGMDASLSRAVGEYFLCTVLGVVVTRRNAYVVISGDGVYAVNGDVTALGPFPDDAPPYLAYALLGSSKHDQLGFSVKRVAATAELRSALIGTDGLRYLIDAEGSTLPDGKTVKPLSQFWEDDFTNADEVRRRLATINRDRVSFDLNGGMPRISGGPLRDDATLVVIRRWGGV